MRKKILVMIIAAITAFGCAFALGACADNGEQPGGSTDDGTVTKLTFEEWYSALTGTFRSNNYSYKIDNGNIVGTVKTQNDKSSLTVDVSGQDIVVMYDVVGQNKLTQYNLDVDTSSWVADEYKNNVGTDFGPYNVSLQFQLGCFSMIDECLCSAFSCALADYSKDLNLEDEDDLKAAAEERYEDVEFDETDATYTVTEGSADSLFTYTFKFLNGKVQSIIATNSDTVITYTNFSFGNVTVTIPDEVLAVQPKQ